jgi:hypothetical protein
MFGGFIHYPTFENLPDSIDSIASINTKEYNKDMLNNQGSLNKLFPVYDMKNFFKTYASSDFKCVIDDSSDNHMMFYPSSVNDTDRVHHFKLKNNIVFTYIKELTVGDYKSSKGQNHVYNFNQFLNYNNNYQRYLDDENTLIEMDVNNEKRLVMNFYTRSNNTDY